MPQRVLAASPVSTGIKKKGCKSARTCRKKKGGGGGGGQSTSLPSVL